MSVSAQSRAGEARVRPTSILYRPKARILIMEFPRQGTYLYHGVSVGAYEMLKQCSAVRASFIGGRRHYSVVTTC